MGCAVAGLFFLRFWKTVRDRLFLYFCLAFWMLAGHWALLGSLHDTIPEDRQFVYLPRLLAFVLILAGVWDKNRGRR